MLELKNICKEYLVGENKQQVLKNINISFRKNEFAAILGPSGSGKTTLLNIIGGLDKYDRGNLIIDGTSTKEYSEKNWDSYRNYRVGFIFQSYNLISHQSVLDNVLIALTLSGISEKERRKKAIAALDKVGLKEHIYKKPNQLSGGQMQRVAIARAIINNPDIILADEPTGALDSENSKQIMDILESIAKERLVIMVTHNFELANNYATRIINLKDGNVISDNNPYKIEKMALKQTSLKKTAMSYLTSLKLSFNNLLTKKGRTLLTAFAGSIGIIGIALVLALSNGVSKYIDNMEKESLSNYPITINETEYDYNAQMNINEEIECEENYICSYNEGLATNDSTSLLKKNNLKELKKYLSSNEEIKDNISDIQYEYDIELNAYYYKDNEYVSLTLKDDKMDYNPFINILGSNDVINSMYDVISGHLPEEKNEVVLVVGYDNTVSNRLLYALNLKDRNKLNNETEKYSYNDLLGLKYKLILNTDYYQLENGIYVNQSSNKKYMQEVISKGLDLEVVGILKPKQDNGEEGFLGYSHKLMEYVIEQTRKTDMANKQLSNPSINVLTGQKFLEGMDTYEEVLKELGIADLDSPVSISIYPKGFDEKEKIVQLIDKYNEDKKREGQEDLVVQYTDFVKLMITEINTMISIVSYILIGLVAVSLIVSSIMISIITYISVLERTKEIGILRALGASRKDITHVFTAETVIEGAIAGLFGVLIAVLLCIPINVILASIIDVKNLAVMPINGAIFLIVLSIILNVIAGYIPAKMASKKDPVESLRAE